MARFNRLSALTFVLLGSIQASGETVIRTFDGGSNPDGWNWGCCNSIPAAGGNPGAYLRTDNLDTFAPQPQPTAANNAFVGDYRALGVTGIGVDLKTFAVDFSAAGRPLTLMLLYDNRTPANPFDDTAAHFMHAQNVPLVGQNWISYEFTIPSDQTSLPVGWQLLNMGDSGSPAIHTWDQVIQNVTDIRFFYGDPQLFFIFQQWDLGLDNVRITLGPKPQPCPADIAPEGGDGAVNVQDLLAVIANWGGGAGNPADIAPPGGDGVVDIGDLLALISAWGTCP
ncbi:MAG: hypothetical protein L0Y44_09585 [Phycisphaerales bacterium]|nr:hypothetical protein [Phycisphaerales bacterium]MCI0630888.1 hypothetical protein [Phycisphaerales bacterium]MCI0676675.1 hypothetical protein [Phycisphaerales bacterium]